MIGDILNDIEAGRRAGCRTVLIDNGNETEWRPGRHRKPHYRAADLAEAARIIARCHVPCRLGSPNIGTYIPTRRTASTEMT
jgi:D-glycero-D-manno-heptose 1,7-bisphosphate phosphatase